MTLLLSALLVASVAVELLLWTPWGWRERRVVAIVSVLLFSVATGGLLTWRPGFGSVCLLLVGCYRLFNLLRMAKARVAEDYLRRVTRKTSAWLMATQVFALGASLLVWKAVFVSTNHWVWAAALVQFVGALSMLLGTWGHLHKMLLKKSGPLLREHELPSVTVAIPARNEDEQLEACLQSIVASDYPKLEVIVLDDCSHDRTPEIIREYAHAGVRFISGTEPETSWLAKNSAYKRLAGSASGELILFCGVDVRFAPQSLRKLVSVMKRKKKAMMSVLPENVQPQKLPYVQSMRYYWELVPPRQLFNRPAVLSTCWIITRESLERAGGFGAVQRSIVPEAYFAKRALEHDGYSFVGSSSSLGIASLKPVNEQVDTAVRTRYPQLHRRPELVLLVSFAELFLLLGPLVLALANIWTGAGWLVEVLALAAFLLQVLLYALLATKLFRKHQLAPVVAFPLAVLGDVALLNYSMYKYEFSDVLWKGRNICLPVMRVIPKLPDVR